MRSVIEVVHACHANHHVYGDCKPANFLLLHPHRATGCQQFPQPRRKGDPAAPPHDGGVVPLAPPPPPQQQQQQPLTGVVVNGVVVAGGVANNVTPLPPRRHTDTIREHLLASFLLPTVPGAASCSGQSFDAPPSSSSASSSSSSSTPAAPPQQLAAAGGVPPLASERCDQLAARAEAAAAAAAAAESDGGCPLLGQTAASSAPAGLRVLADALPLESWVLHQQCSQPEAPQGGDGAAAAAARARALHLERCGLQCHEEMTVLATDFGCCQPLCQAPAGQRGLARGLTSGKRLGSPVSFRAVRVTVEEGAGCRASRGGLWRRWYLSRAAAACARLLLCSGVHGSRDVAGGRAGQPGRGRVGGRRHALPAAQRQVRWGEGSRGPER